MEKEDLLDEVSGAATQETLPKTEPQSSPETVTLETVLKELGELKSQIRGVQSATDKTKAEAKREIKGLTEQIARYEEYRKRLSPEQAVREMEIDDILAERKRVPESGITSAPDAKPVKETSAPDVDPQVFGLDPNDTAVVEMMREGKANLQSLYELSVSRKTKPNPAAVQPTATGASVDNTDALTKQLVELQKDPNRNIKEIREVTNKLKSQMGI